MAAVCPRCGSAVALNAIECPLCGLTLAEWKEDSPVAPPIPGAPAPPPLPGSPAQGAMPTFAIAEVPQPPSRTAATVTCYLVGITSAAALLSIFANLNEISVLRRIRTAFFSSNINAIGGLQADALAADDRQSAANMLVLVAFIVTGIVWMFWQSRAQRSLRSLAQPGTVKFRESDAVVWWIVPIANLWMPLRVNRELHRESSSLANQNDARIEIVHQWWAVYIAAAVLGLIGSAISSSVQDRTDISASYFNQLTMSHWVTIGGRLATIVAGVLAIWLVRRATANLETAYRKTAAGPAA
jgi:eukaryotic-like serine/threonine-protein kinase